MSAKQYMTPKNYQDPLPNLVATRVIRKKQKGLPRYTYINECFVYLCHVVKSCSRSNILDPAMNEITKNNIAISIHSWKKTAFT